MNLLETPNVWQKVPTMRRNCFKSSCATLFLSISAIAYPDQRLIQPCMKDATANTPRLCTINPHGEQHSRSLFGGMATKEDRDYLNYYVILLRFVRQLVQPQHVEFYRKGCCNHKVLDATCYYLRICLKNNPFAMTGSPGSWWYILKYFHHDIICWFPCLFLEVHHW